MEQASGRERAFVAISERHYGDVLTYARRRTDEASARDVAAETFTVAWRRHGEVERLDLPWLLPQPPWSCRTRSAPAGDRNAPRVGS